MLKGDLSPHLAPAIGMRIEGVLKVLGKLNRPAKGFLDHITGRGSVNIYLVTLEDRRKAMAFCTKWGVPYTTILQADSTLEIADLVRENHMLAYFDVDEQVIENVRDRRGQTPIDAQVWKGFNGSI